MVLLSYLSQHFTETRSFLLVLASQFNSTTVSSIINLDMAAALLSLACSSGFNFANADNSGVIYYGTAFTVYQSSDHCKSNTNECFYADKAFDGNTNGNHGDRSVSLTTKEFNP